MSWYNPVSWVDEGAEFLANPLLASADVGKSVVGGVNDIMGRGYDSASDYQQQIYDLYDQNESNINEIYDPKLRDYQMQGLDQLMDISNDKNLDATSLAQLNKIRSQEGQIEKGARGAIMQNANERGAGTSSGSLLDQLTNAQSASERRTNQDTDVLANQQKRALDALYGSINTAGKINSQDMSRAEALDLFNRYNLTGKATSLSNQGQIAQNKAGSENDFWGGIIGGGANLLAGNPAGAAGSLSGSTGSSGTSGAWGDYNVDPWEMYA